mgnify:FL=1
MTTKKEQDIMVNSFRAVIDVIRDLDEDCQNDPQSMLRGAIHALYTTTMYNAPSPMIGLTFLLEELQHFAQATCEIVPDDEEWGKGLSDLTEEKDDNDETMH